MADMKDIVKLAVDNYHGAVEKYSAAQASDVLRQAMIEANGGSTRLNYRDIRDGKCAGLFSIIEQVLAATVVEGLQQDDFFYNMVDFRNIALGDLNQFLVEDSTLFQVSELADGSQGVRRQRLEGYETVQLQTSLKGVKIYEEMVRVLSGQVDFNHMIDKVSQSMKARMLDDIYSIWMSASGAELGGSIYNPGGTVYTAAGTYDEDTLLDLIAHIEAASNGKPVTILGTARALRHLAPAMTSIDAANDLYHNGAFSSFYGNNVVKLPNRHKVGTTSFVFDDHTLTVMAGDEKPIKCVYEGDPLIIPGNPLDKADLTHEYLYADRYGLGIVLAGGNAGTGKYTISD